MSATFKNARKKISQHELRRIMKEHQNKAKPEKKVESPLARYNDLGQLTCVLCQSIVRSEAVWPVHINSKQHREKVEHAKKLKEKTNNFTTSLKRPLTPPLEVSNKKPKGILKNGPSRIAESEDTTSDSNTGNGVPDDFFDNKTGPFEKDAKKPELEKMEVDPQAIPEGFFDDPKQDAKARKIDYKEPLEEEWEKFQKAIREADNVSAAIIAEDQEEATNERQIDEIDEQMKNWSRVLSLERKKTEVVSTLNKNSQATGDEMSADDDDDFDEYLDWRSKKSFKR